MSRCNIISHNSSSELLTTLSLYPLTDVFQFTNSINFNALYARQQDDSTLYILPFPIYDIQVTLQNQIVTDYDEYGLTDFLIL